MVDTSYLVVPQFRSLPPKAEIQWSDKNVIPRTSIGSGNNQTSIIFSDIVVVYKQETINLEADDVFAIYVLALLRLIGTNVLFGRLIVRDDY